MSALFTNTPSQQNGKPLRATIMTTRIFHTLVLPIALAVLGGQANAASVTTYSAANGAWRLEQSALQPPLTLRARAGAASVSYTHLRAHETDSYLVCRLLL